MSNEIAANLQRACEILHVTIRRPRMTFKIPKATISVGELELSNQAVTTPSWKLMPTELEARIDKVENEVTKVLEAHGVRFRSRPRGASSAAEDQYQIRSVHLVPAVAVERLLGLLQGLEERLKTVVREWADDPDRLRTAVRLKLGPDAFDMVEDRIPTGPELMDATSLEIVSLPLGVDLDDVRSSADSLLLASARRRTTEMLESVTESVVAQPRLELADAVEQLRELISRDGRVTSKSFVPIRRAIEKLRTFSFVMDEVLEQKVQELSSRIDALTPSDQNSQTAESSGLMGMLQEVQTVASQPELITKYAKRVGGFRVSTGP